MCRVVNYDGSEHCPWEARGGYKGRLSYHPEIEVKEFKEPKRERVKTPAFVRKTKNCIAFYTAYGDGFCGEYATNWCREHCYLKTQPFSKDVIDEIQKVNITNYDFNSFAVDDLVDKIESEKYITFFASGCIDDMQSDQKKFVQDLSETICSKVKNSKSRFFIRNPRTKWKCVNSVIILSVDNESSENIITKGLRNITINGIAIIDHPDNEDLINLVTNKLFKKYSKCNIDNVIYCKNCNGKMLCFKQKKRFILIQEYKK